MKGEKIDENTSRFSHIAGVDINRDTLPVHFYTDAIVYGV